MAKAKRKKVEPEPVELQESHKTRLVKTKEFVRGNEKTIWRTFQTALLGLLIWAANSAPGYIDKYMERQKVQSENQKAWQVRAEARHRALLKNDSILIAQNKLLFKHLKIKIK